MGCPWAAEGAAKTGLLPVFFRTPISATTGPIYSNSSLIEASPCVHMHYVIFFSVGEMMGSPWAALGALWEEVLSVFAVTMVEDHASLVCSPCDYETAS